MAIYDPRLMLFITNNAALLKKALSGDKEAQEIFTQKGIPIQCPFCGSFPTVLTTGLTDPVEEEYGYIYSSYWKVECTCGCSTKKYGYKILLNKFYGTIEQVYDESNELPREAALREWNTRSPFPDDFFEDDDAEEEDFQELRDDELEEEE